MHKQILRNKYLQLRKQLSAEKINDLSKQICEKFLLFVSQNLQNWQQQQIAIYYATKYEVSTTFLQQYFQENNLTYCLPKINDDKLDFYEVNRKTKLIANSKFSQILEPESKKKILPDIIIVPLVAIDTKLNRLGMGKGYYDKTLANIRAISIGFAFDLQVCKQDFLPQKHDYRLDYLVTETQILQKK
jgi:5-formyltetrahydrofolate cyclo-ligase